VLHDNAWEVKVGFDCLRHQTFLVLGEVDPRSPILPIDHDQPLNSSFSEVNYPFLFRCGFLILL